MDASDKSLVINTSDLNIDRTAENFERTGNSLTPTETVTRELQALSTYSNRCFFNSELPECMLTIDRFEKCALGYFSPNSFVSKDGDLIHQISINPSHMLTRNLKDVFSTLVHEHCHLWEFEFGGRKTCNGYHGKIWGAKMESIGLIPSNTGKPDGKKTGYRMTHYIEVGGVFDRACYELVNGQFGISWGLATEQMRDDGGPGTSGKNGPKKNDRSKGKVKFLCPVCNKACWAAPTRNLICGDDHSILEMA